MIGAIIGDVVGSRFEFHNIKSKDFSMFHPSCHITDATVMTIAVAKSMYEYFSSIGNLEDLCVKNIQHFGRKARTTYGTMFHKWIWSDNPEPYNSYDNYAAMYISPVAYFPSSLERCREFAHKIASVTHNHPQALKDAECVACCVYLSIHNYDKDFIRKYVNENFYKLNFTLDEIKENYTSSGDCAKSVPYAVECFLEGDTFEDVIRNAISIGGDSDTIAAIAGSIAEFSMPPKYYKIARHYCRKNLFLWRQFKYVEIARANVMYAYRETSPEYESMQMPFIEKYCRNDELPVFPFRLTSDQVRLAPEEDGWYFNTELERRRLTGKCNLSDEELEYMEYALRIQKFQRNERYFSRNSYLINPILIQLSSSLVPIVERKEKSKLTKAIKKFRRKHLKEKSIKIPEVRIMNNPELSPYEFTIKIYDEEKLKAKIENTGNVLSVTYKIMTALEKVVENVEFWGDDSIALNFIALDFETANYNKDSAISIGLVKYEYDGTYLSKNCFYNLIKPNDLTEDYILPDFTEIHGLTCEDIKDAPLFDDLWESNLKNWFDGSLPIVAHNAAFDIGVLEAVFEKYSIKHNELKYFDSLAIARATWEKANEVENHRLVTLAEKFGIEYDAHNALADAETCQKIILLAAKKHGCKTLDELLKATGQEFKYIAGNNIE